MDSYFFRQKHISRKNLKRLEKLSQHSDPQISDLARVLFHVARLYPAKRGRWKRVRASHPEQLQRLSVLEFCQDDFFNGDSAGYADDFSAETDIADDDFSAPQETLALDEPTDHDADEMHSFLDDDIPL